MLYKNKDNNNIPDTNIDDSAYCVRVSVPSGELSGDTAATILFLKRKTSFEI